MILRLREAADIEILLLFAVGWIIESSRLILDDIVCYRLFFALTLIGKFTSFTGLMNCK